MMFRSAASSLAFLPKDGLHVLVRGRLSYYEPRGEIQLVVEFMGPAGLGLFHLEFQRVRGILEKEGLLSSERKRPIPAMPRAVALITSPPGGSNLGLPPNLRPAEPADSRGDCSRPNAGKRCGGRYRPGACPGDP